MTEKHFETLKQIIENIVDKLFIVERSIALAEEIGKYSHEINNAGFGTLWRFVQTNLINSIILNIANIFERNKRYRVKSIFAALQLLDKHASEWIVNKEYFERNFAERFQMKNINTLTDEQITLLVVSKSWGLLLNINPPIDDVLLKIKEVRDKYISHNELIKTNVEPYLVKPTEIKHVIQPLKEILPIISMTYLNLLLEYDGEYFLSKDTEDIKYSLRWLLVKSMIIKPNEHESDRMKYLVEKKFRPWLDE